MNKQVLDSFWNVSLLVAALALTGCVMDLNVALTKADQTSEVIPSAPPVPTIQVSIPSLPYGSSTTSFTYTVTYTNVATVDLQDSHITLGGTDTAGCAVHVTNGTTLTPTVTITGCTGDGTVNFSIAADTGEDALGNKTSAFGPSQDSLIAHAFIITIDTSLGDGNSSMVLPVGGWSGNNFTIDWGDGSAIQHVQNGVTWNGPGSGLISRTYTAGGIYNIKIKGQIPYFGFRGTHTVSDDVDKLKIIDVKQWGINILGTAEQMFSGCANLRVSAKDAPDLSIVTTMVNMFAGASSFNDPIGHWDTSNVQLMVGVFTGATSFNQPLQNWKTHNVTSMASMFGNAAAFNQDISHFETHNVTEMGYMFFGAVSYNSPMPTDGNKWNTSNVTNMESMFASMLVFNQDISSWDVGSVTNMDNLFKTSPAFNRNLSGWDVSSVTTHSYYDQDATAWDNANKPFP